MFNLQFIGAFPGSVHKRFHWILSLGNFSETKPGSMNMIQSNATGAPLFLRVNYSLVKIDPSDILYIECADNYMKLHLKEGRPLLVRITLKALMTMLPEGFMRIHRSYVVALNQISAIRNRSLKIGTSELPLGVSYEEPLMRRIKNSPTFGHAHY